MNFEQICYGCFQEKPEGSPVCPHCGFDQQAEQPFLALPLGTLLNGRYVTGKVLGVGGFGITYLGYDLTLEIKVCLLYTSSASLPWTAMRRTVCWLCCATAWGAWRRGG